MKVSTLRIISLIVLLVSSAQHCGGVCGVKVIQDKRVIINASNVEVVLKSLYTEVDSIHQDTITQFTHIYAIASGDSLVSLDKCSYRVGSGCSPSNISCQNLVGSFGFQVNYNHNYAQLIFDNRRIQVFHKRTTPGLLNKSGYTIDRSDPNLPVSTYIITPEDYENAKPINP